MSTYRANDTKNKLKMKKTHISSMKKKHQSGIIVYVKDSINCKQILLNNSFTEYTLLELKLQTNKVLQRCIESPNSLQDNNSELFILFDEICKKNPVTNYL